MLSSVGAHAPTPKYKFSVNQQIFTIEIIGQAANPWTVHPPPFSSSFAPDNIYICSQIVHSPSKHYCLSLTEQALPYCHHGP